MNRAIRARERVELVKESDGVSVGHSHVGDPLDDALARLADPLVSEIQNGRTDRIRICANDTCRWVFFDESRAGRRIWCDMASCGNRAKAARHRARAKASAAAPLPAVVVTEPIRSSIGRTSVASRVIDSSSCGDGSARDEVPVAELDERRDRRRHVLRRPDRLVGPRLRVGRSGRTPPETPARPRPGCHG